MAFVSKVTPAFDAQYASRSFIATSPSTDPIFTIAPPPHFRNSFSAARDIRNGPFTFTVITRSHSSSVMLSTVETCSAPALFTSTFSRPNCLTVSRTARSTSLPRVTSHSTAEALPPSFFTSPVTARSFSSRRPAKATPAPSRANARAIARPIPVPPPLIRATFPESRVTLFGAPASNRDAAAAALCAARVGATLASGSLARKPLRWTPAASRSGLKVLYFNDPSLTCRRIEDRFMRIGITCYPTYGGSGVVATELGMELASRGHEVHFISYAPPIRMQLGNGNIRFHEVEVASYPLFDHPPYTLALATKMLEVFEAESLDLLHVHYAIPHSVSALLARSMAAPRRLPFITTLHGTDITLVGNNRSYLPITRFSIEQSDGVTAISHYLRRQTLAEFDIKNPIEVIPNFVNCDLYCRSPKPEERLQWAPNGEAILMHLSNFRPVKRVTDVVEIFALLREKMPAKLVLIGDGPDRGSAEWLVRQKWLGRDVHLLGKAAPVHEKACP